MRDRSRTFRHHSSREAARHVRPTLSSVSTRSSAFVTSRRSSSGSASRNGPGALGSGRSDNPSSRAERACRGHPVVGVRGRPHCEHDATPRPQDPYDLGERAGGIGHEHHAEAADNAVDRRVAEIDRRSVLDPELDVLDPELGSTPARGGDHLRSNIRREQQSVRPEPLRCDEAGVARACGELEHGVARTWVEQSHHALVEIARHLAAECRLALPARGGSPPGLDLLVLGGGYVATCANCGMMSRPYASSTSSWPSVMR